MSRLETSAGPIVDGHEDHVDMLRASVADFLRRGNSMARVRELRGARPGYDRGVWREMAELGWFGILMPVSYAGLGLGFSEMAIVVKGIGRSVLPEPVVASAVLAGLAILHGDNEALKKDLIPQLVRGELIPALAWQETIHSQNADARTTHATASGGALRLSGRKGLVYGGLGADGFVVSACNRDKTELYWVPATTRGISLDVETIADGRYAVALTMRDAEVSSAALLGSAEVGSVALRRSLDEAIFMISAECCGVTDRALEISLDYMQMRVQFGKPIGAFQALQHRAADLYVRQRVATAVLDQAIMELDHGCDGRMRSVWASRVKSRCSDGALRATREAIQLHGAMGYTDEHDIGLYLKRALVLAAWLGNGTMHRRRYAELASVDWET